MANLFSAFVLLVFTCSFLSCSSEVSRKELRNKEFSRETVIQLHQSIPSNSIDPSRVVQLSWQPRSGSSCIEAFYQMRSVTTLFLWYVHILLFQYNNLLCLGWFSEKNEFWAKARGIKEKSFGNEGESDSVIMKRLPTNSEIPSKIEDDIVAGVEKRISAWTFLPEENSKSIQVVHYGHEETGKNFDYFGNKSRLTPSETVLATVILYLSNVSQGGEILFHESETKSKIWSDCPKSRTVLRPVKGNAILFFTLHPNGSPDKSSVHARCPVLEGEMWGATKFFYVRAVNRENLSFELDNSKCTDEDQNCSQWAALGECQRNPVFMIGSPDYYGTCMKSCKAC